MAGIEDVTDPRGVEPAGERERPLEVPAQAEGVEGLGPQLEAPLRGRVGCAGEFIRHEVEIGLEALDRFMVEGAAREYEGLGLDGLREVQEPVEVLAALAAGLGAEGSVEVPDVSVDGSDTETACGHVGGDGFDGGPVQCVGDVVAHAGERAEVDLLEAHAGHGGEGRGQVEVPEADGGASEPGVIHRRGLPGGDEITTTVGLLSVNSQPKESTVDINVWCGAHWHIMSTVDRFEAPGKTLRGSLSILEGTAMSNEALALRGPVHGTADARRVAIGSSVGAVIETYDFIGFGTAAALYFGKAFFPGADPLTGTLASFATLGVGFAARPLGGFIGGHLGDRLGRKPVLVASLMVMGLATFAIGLLPTYAMVGLLAPALLVSVRIVQGIAFGAEWGGAILMAYEHAPWKKKGKFTGMVQSGFPVGLLLANLVFLVSVHLGDMWAWRVPFLASIVLVIVGIIIRTKVPESPVFEDVKGAGQLTKAPIVEVVKHDWRNILRGIGLRIAETAGYAVSVTYMISYLNSKHLANTTETLTALCIASAIGIFATTAWGQLTDRIGRRPLYIWSCVFAVLFGVPMFLLVNTGLFLFVVATIVIAYAVCQNSLAGVQGAWFPELFRANTRSSGASLAYQISATISGFTPFITTILFVALGWLGPALLFSVYGAIGLWAALATRETWGPRERKAAEEASAATPQEARA